MQYSMPRNRGFTLIELMVVVAIVAILAAIALPAYNDYIIRGNFPTATNQLSAYRAQLEQYYQDARQYTSTGAFTSPCPTTPTTPTNSKWTYQCTTLTMATYKIQASGVAGTVVAGFTFTLDNTNAQATTAAPTGWQTSGSKWCMNKGCS